MADSGGLRVESAEMTARPEFMLEIQQMELAPEFRHYDLEQLAATSLTLIASS